VNGGSPPQTFTHQQLINQGGFFNNQTNTWVFSITHVFNSVSCGVSSTLNNTTYSNALQASITVSNPCGQSSNANGPYTIQSAPQANFTASPNDSIVCVNTTITFTNTSIAGTNVVGPSPNFTCNNQYKKYWTILGPSGLIPVFTQGPLNNTQVGTVLTNPFVTVVGNLGWNYNQPNNSQAWSPNSTNQIAVTFLTPGSYTITLYTGSNSYFI
jgi:hypothetical protein